MAKERRVFSIKNFKGIDTTSEITKVAIERATAGKNFELHSGSFKTRPSIKYEEVISKENLNYEDKEYELGWLYVGGPTQNPYEMDAHIADDFATREEALIALDNNYNDVNIVGTILRLGSSLEGIDIGFEYAGSEAGGYVPSGIVVINPTPLAFDENERGFMEVVYQNRGTIDQIHLGYIFGFINNVSGKKWYFRVVWGHKYYYYERVLSKKKDLNEIKVSNFIAREKYKDVYFYVFYDFLAQKVKFKYSNEPSKSVYLPFVVENYIKEPRISFAEANDNLYIFGLDGILAFNGETLSYVSDEEESVVQAFVPTLFLGDKTFESRNMLSKKIKSKMSGDYGVSKHSFAFPYDFEKDGAYTHRLKIKRKNENEEKVYEPTSSGYAVNIRLKEIATSTHDEELIFKALNKTKLLYKSSEDENDFALTIEKLKDFDFLKFYNDDGIIEELIHDALRDYDGETRYAEVAFEVEQVKAGTPVVVTTINVYARYEITILEDIKEINEVYNSEISVKAYYLSASSGFPRARYTWRDGDVSSYILVGGFLGGFFENLNDSDNYTEIIKPYNQTIPINEFSFNRATYSIDDIEDGTLPLSDFGIDTTLLANKVKELWFESPEAFNYNIQYTPAGKQGRYTKVLLPIRFNLVDSFVFDGKTFNWVVLCIAFAFKNISVDTNISWEKVKKNVLVDEDPIGTSRNYYALEYNKTIEAFELTINGYSVPAVRGDFNITLELDFEKNRYEDALVGKNVTMKYDIDDLVLIGGKDQHIYFNYSSTLPEYVDKYNYYPVANIIEAGRKPIYAMVRSGDTAIYVFSDTLYVVRELLLENGLRSFSSGYKTNLKPHELPRNADSVVSFDNNIIIINEKSLYHLYLRDNIETDERQVFERGRYAREFITAHKGYSRIVENNQRLYVTFENSLDVLMVDRDYMISYQEDYKQYEPMIWELPRPVRLMMEKEELKLYRQGVIYHTEENEQDELIEVFNDASYTIKSITTTLWDNLHLGVNVSLRETMKVGDKVEIFSDTPASVFVGIKDFTSVPIDGKFSVVENDLLAVFGDGENFTIAHNDGTWKKKEVTLVRDSDDISKYWFKDTSNTIITYSTFYLLKNIDGLELEVVGKSLQYAYLSYRGLYQNEGSLRILTIDGSSDGHLILTKHYPIEVVWTSAITDFGNDMMQKTMFSMQLLFTNFSGNNLDFGYRTNRFYDKTTNISTEFARLGDLNFEFFSISPRYKHSYNLMRKENNFLYIQFVIKAVGRIGVDGINIIYKNNRVLFGLG